MLQENWRIASESGVTLILVSHSAAEAKQFCERAIWLESGTLRQVGPSERVVEEYLATMAEKDARYAVRHHDTEKTEGFGASSMFVIPENRKIGLGRRGDHGVSSSGRQRMASRSPGSVPSCELDRPNQRNGDIAQPVVGFAVRNHLRLSVLGNRHGCSRPATLPPI